MPRYDFSNLTKDADADLPEEVMWKGRWITAKRRGKWEYASRARGIRAAAIIAIYDNADGTRDVILVSQYRVPIGKFCLEIPAGLVGDEEGQEGEETLGAAARELEEETGYRAGSLENLGEFYSSSGMISEGITLLRAHMLEKVAEGGGVEGENIVVHRVPVARLPTFVREWREAGHAVDLKLAILMGSEILGETLK